MVLVLSDEDVGDILDLESLADVVERALVKQGNDEVERPDRHTTRSERASTRRTLPGWDW